MRTLLAYAAVQFDSMTN